MLRSSHQKLLHAFKQFAASLSINNATLEGLIEKRINKELVELKNDRFKDLVSWLVRNPDEYTTDVGVANRKDKEKSCSQAAGRLAPGELGYCDYDSSKDYYYLPAANPGTTFATLTGMQHMIVLTEEWVSSILFRSFQFVSSTDAADLISYLTHESTKVTTEVHWVPSITQPTMHLVQGLYLRTTVSNFAVACVPVYERKLFKQFQSLFQA